MRCLACLQVLQYNPYNTAWTKIGSLKKRRAYHAVAEVNLAAFGCVGNLDLKQENKIINIIFTMEICVKI